jgi:hypothetical protein
MKEVNILRSALFWDIMRPDVSEQRTGPIFKGQKSEKKLD